MKKSVKILVAVLIILIGLRIYLPVWATNYVNGVLADIPGYRGSIEDVDINLYRGAYKINKLRIDKTDSDVPVPFVDIDVIDLSVEWKALLHGRIVGEINFIKPTVNFVASGDTSSAQSGANTDWTKPVKDLIPLQINRLAITDGKIVYHDFESNPKINLPLDSLQVEATNLSNVMADSVKLPSTITVSAVSIGGGKLAINAKANVLKEIPDFDIDAKLENVSLPALNDFSGAYAKLDFEKGTFNLYSEMAADSGRFDGYVKPILRNIKVVDLKEDAKKPLKLIWESVAGFVIHIFQNQPKDQFATKVPMHGNLNSPNTAIWPTIGNVFKNAFISAFAEGTDNDVSFEDVKQDK